MEAALAHATESKAEAACARGDLLEKRRALAGSWVERLAGWVGASMRPQARSGRQLRNPPSAIEPRRSAQAFALRPGQGPS